MKYDLENRLIEFSILVIDIAGQISFTQAGKILSNQLIRSGTSVSLNYVEAQSAESRKDFIHKIKLVLKELRETKVCLEIIQRGLKIKDKSLIHTLKSENEELIAIFVKSIQTTRMNQLKQG